MCNCTAVEERHGRGMRGHKEIAPDSAESGAIRVRRAEVGAPEPGLNGVAWCFSALTALLRDAREQRAHLRFAVAAMPAERAD
jgi:hypothetical protein